MGLRRAGMQSLHPFVLGQCICCLAVTGIGNAPPIWSIVVRLHVRKGAHSYSRSPKAEATGSNPVGYSIISET